MWVVMLRGFKLVHLYLTSLLWEVGDDDINLCFLHACMYISFLEDYDPLMFEFLLLLLALLEEC